MTIDEAIRHCEEVAKENYNIGFLCHANPNDEELDKCVECAREHEQLAEWLKELKAYKEQDSDAISRQAVLDGLASIAKAKAKSDAQKSLMGRVMFFTEQLPSVTPQQRTGWWIPVSKRLPEENGYYLTTTMYGDVYCDYWAEVGFDRQETIIAWQPLPEPYKAESEDKG